MRPARRRRGGWLAVWASALVVGGGAAASRVGAGDASPAVHTVTIDGTAYQPARLTVHAGDTVVWRNTDLVPHTVTSKGGAFDSDVLAKGTSWQLTTRKTGTFDYACVFHPTMKGQLTVE